MRCPREPIRSRVVSSETRARIPDAPWAAIPSLCNVVVHEYSRIDPELILDIVENQLTPLKDQLQRQ